MILRDPTIAYKPDGSPQSKTPFRLTCKCWHLSRLSSLSLSLCAIVLSQVCVLLVVSQLCALIERLLLAFYSLQTPKLVRLLRCCVVCVCKTSISTFWRQVVLYQDNYLYFVVCLHSCQAWSVSILKFPFLEDRRFSAPRVGTVQFLAICYMIPFLCFIV